MESEVPKTVFFDGPVPCAGRRSDITAAKIKPGLFALLTSLKPAP